MQGFISKTAEVGSTRKSRPKTVDRVTRRSLLRAWFLNLSTVSMLGQMILCCGTAGLCRVFSSIPDPCLLDASSRYDNHKASRHYQMSSEEDRQHHPRWTTTGLERPGGSTKVRKLLHVPEASNLQEVSPHRRKRNACVQDTGINTGTWVTGMEKGLSPIRKPSLRSRFSCLKAARSHELVRKIHYLPREEVINLTKSPSRLHMLWQVSFKGTQPWSCKITVYLLGSKALWEVYSESLQLLTFKTAPEKATGVHHATRWVYIISLIRQGHCVGCHRMGGVVARPRGQVC